ncbi:CarD family transcriptional regulator [Alkalicoccus halolimnae]|uniref:CarD family transcriptional regulator n=1 Tax=Alkalicoccus halolimnae TaxID=1667239 RepID=A0A5C7FJF8_9BACI|nr:CarD family transcriptional regulator [Alkalicoccus halolimnae]TXF86424.1 CarD family transcriptional regulator [Alkalicoccus halolimnae]
MFEVGDHVVYPGHGAGTVQEVMKKTILNEEQLYFVVYFPLQRITLMLPEKKIMESGLRSTTEASELMNILESYGHKDIQEEFQKPSRRQDERLNSGTVEDCVDVYFELTCKKSHSPQKLHIEEKKSLDLARKLLISELMLVHDTSEMEAVTMLESRINTPLKEA